MPRVKASNPSHLSLLVRQNSQVLESDQGSQNDFEDISADIITLGDSPEEIIIDDDDSDEVIVIPKLETSTEESCIQTSSDPVDLALQECSFYVPLSRTSRIKSKEFSAFLGELTLELADSTYGDLPDREQSWLYVSEQEGFSLLYYEWTKENEGEKRRFKKKEIERHYYKIRGCLPSRALAGKSEPKISKF